MRSIDQRLSAVEAKVSPGAAIADERVYLALLNRALPHVTNGEGGPAGCRAEPDS